MKRKTFAFGIVRVSNEVFNRRVTICHMRLSVLDHSDMSLVLFRNLIRMHRRLSDTDLISRNENGVAVKPNTEPGLLLL